MSIRCSSTSHSADSVSCRERSGEHDLVRNDKELFNLRHSSCRMIIERVIGVLKARFPVLDRPLSHTISFQRDLLPGLCALHNFLQAHNDRTLESRLEARVNRQLNDEALGEVRTAWVGGRRRELSPRSGREEDGYASEEVEGDSDESLRRLQSAARRRQELVEHRDTMASNMWAQYQETLAARRAG